MFTYLIFSMFDPILSFIKNIFIMKKWVLLFSFYLGINIYYSKNTVTLYMYDSFSDGWNNNYWHMEGNCRKLQCSERLIVSCGYNRYITK